MKFIHVLNAVMWFANTIAWGFYAHQKWFAVASVLGMAVSLYLAVDAHNDYMLASAAKERRVARARAKRYS